jgi:hypothetical protein
VPDHRIYMFQIKNSRHQRYLTVVLHLLVWAIIFNLPMLSTGNAPHTMKEYFRSWVPPVAFALVFYINYFYLIPRLLFTKRTWQFFVSNAILYAITITLLEEVKTIMIPIPGPHAPHVLEVIVRFIIAFSMATGVSVAIRITGEWFRSEDIRKDLEKEHLKSELVNLKNQLNPHFFFNTLNTIYGLIVQNQEVAQDAVHRLSKLMRYHLYDSNERYVPLRKEIEFMVHFIDLMKLRITPNVLVQYNFPEVTHDIMVAPLLFIPLIENSFKHGVHLNKPSEIVMTLEVIHQKQIVFYIRNTSFPKKENDQSGSGIGLENLKKRLSLLYPERYTFVAEENGAYFDCTLTIHV